MNECEFEKKQGLERLTNIVRTLKIEQRKVWYIHNNEKLPEHKIELDEYEIEKKSIHKETGLQHKVGSNQIRGYGKLEPGNLLVNAPVNSEPPVSLTALASGKN